MASVRIANSNHPEREALRVRRCDTFLSRFRGLMFTPSIDTSEGILIDEKADSRLNSTIHMFFMRFDIAAVWINEDLTVVDRVIARKGRPYYAPNRPARYILEIHPDRFHDFQPGDRVKLLND